MQYVCVLLMLNFYASWASFQNSMQRLKQTFILAQILVPRVIKYLWLVLKENGFNLIILLPWMYEFYAQPHINLLVLGKTEAQVNCISASWMSWGEKCFYVSHFAHLPALSFLPSSPFLFSTMTKFTLPFDSVSVTITSLTHWYSSNILFIFTELAPHCLCMSHPYSPWTSLIDWKS